jgi:hypothetical protein
LFAALACGNAAGGGGDAAVGGTDGAAGVPCDEAEDGDPCGRNAEFCGPLHGYGCTKFCNAGAWRVTCTQPPTCATSNIGQGNYCNPAGPMACGPFPIYSLCGAVSVNARCIGEWWAYELPCDPACESLGEDDCNVYTGCVWAVPCPNPNFPPAAPRCIDFPPRRGFCDSITCPAGTTCVGVAINPDDISSGDCTLVGAAAAFCEPPAAAAASE